MFDPSIFRMYDIRGLAGVQLSEELALGVGRALGTRIRRDGGGSAAVGRDVRHSSPGLAAAAAAGLARSGLEVADLGEIPTPGLGHALHTLGLGGGIMVTGSHNPKSDNGLKLTLGKASLYGDQITSLPGQIESGDFVDGSGSVRDEPYRERYVDDLCRRFSFGRRLRVAIDCGNGIMGPVAVPALERLGFEVLPLYCDPDGDFPNHIPDPEVPAYMETLRRTVVSEGCQLGLGFDGDGDRVGVIDERGRKISADWLLALFARDLLRRHRGGRVRFDVKCSDFLAEDVRAHGGEPIMGETGHSLLKRDVAALDALIGGELSGHIVFNRGYLPLDDALYSALYLLQLLEESGGTTSELFRGFPDLVSTAEIKVPCPDRDKFEVVAGLVEHFQREHEVLDIDGARVRLEDGWFLVRASNTTPNLTVRFESRSVAGLERARDLLVAALAAWPAADPTPLEGRLVDEG
jgi:phosphomannomutase/phosphoglucomutase